MLERLTGLRNGDNVMSGQDARDAVTLNGRRYVVLTELDVLEHDGV